MNLIYLLIGFQVLLLVAGQILWKTELSKFGDISTDNIIKILLSPHIMLGIFIYMIATFVWFYILSKEAFNIVYPLQLSLAAIFGVAVSVFFLHESITLPRLAGILFLIIGAFLIVKK
jgi:drug/metabolite transporter (DMT)-like permease